MTLPPLKLEDGNTIFIDNSRYEFIMRCMRSAEYGIVFGRVTADTKQALKFGEALHLVLKFRYKFYGTDPVDEAGQIRQFLILEKFWENNPTPMGDHRTLGFAQSVIEAYNAFYKQESFDILKTPTGVPIVEEGFALPLGEVGKFKIVWKGRLDLGISEVGDIWAFDNKSTAMGGEFSMTEYFTSNQMKGYTWALKTLLGERAKGAIINQLVCRKKSKTGKGIEFSRGKFEYDEDALAEWQQNTLHVVSDFLHSYDRGYFPMETSQCVGRYGKCQYHQTCTLAPAARLQDLMSDIYKPDAFDPLHEDAINLDEIAKSPIPSNYKRITQEQEEQVQTEQMGAVMKDLLNL